MRTLIDQKVPHLIKVIKKVFNGLFRTVHQKEEKMLMQLVNSITQTIAI